MQSTSTVAGTTEDEVLETSQPGRIELRGKTVRVVLKPTAVGPKGIASVASQLSPKRQLYLILRGLHTDTQPGVLYHIYLDLPEPNPPATKTDWYVGMINFFEATPASDSETVQLRSMRSFNVTDLVKRLSARRSLYDQTTITITTPRQAELQANPTIDSIQLVLQESIPKL